MKKNHPSSLKRPGQADGGARSSRRTRATLYALWSGLLILSSNVQSLAATFDVQVAPGGELVFNPAELAIQPGDTVKWTWFGTHAHSVTSGQGTPDGLFNSSVRSAPSTFSFTFPNAGTFNYYCIPHADFGMAGRIIVGGTPAQLLNISTRLRVEGGDNVLIGGFIVTGTQPKKIIARALGPSLPLNGKLANPTLELVGPGGQIATNNDWRSAQEAEIIASTVPPGNDLESAIVATLPANSTGYTAIVRGVSEGTGVGLIEVYDLDQAANSKLANISTRGSVQTGDNVMIGGYILGRTSNAAKVLIRGLGPSLSSVANPLADPTLELRDGNGTLVRTNNNWKDSQQAEVAATGVPPTNDLESAIVATLPPAPYTAILAGQSGGTGVGLVEVYQIP